MRIIPLAACVVELVVSGARARTASPRSAASLLTLDSAMLANEDDGRGG
jgi:hypothetical protein